MWMRLLALVLLTLTSTSAAAQPHPIPGASLTTTDLGEGFVEVALPGASGRGHDGLTEPPPEGALVTYTAFFEPAAGGAEPASGPLLIGNVIGVGGPPDLDRILHFFLTRSPVRPPAPFVAPTDGPAVGDQWRWIAFPARVIDPGLRAPVGQVMDVHAVAFRSGDRVALVMTAGPPSTVTQAETVHLARLVAERLAFP
jgi:hypothetical protein